MPARKHILNRYARDDKDRFIIDVAAGKIADFYNDFDKVAPFNKKDLDANLVDYLSDSARELEDHPFSIRISLPQTPGDQTTTRVKKSIHNFFHYMAELESREIRNKVRTSVILTGIGVIILTAAIWFNRLFAERTGIMIDIVAEGLIIAAWVSLWEAVATFLIHWPPHRRNQKLYNRLAHAQVTFFKLEKE